MEIQRLLIVGEVRWAQRLCERDARISSEQVHAVRAGWRLRALQIASCEAFAAFVVGPEVEVGEALSFAGDALALNGRGRVILVVLRPRELAVAVGNRCTLLPADASPGLLAHVALGGVLDPVEHVSGKYGLTTRETEVLRGIEGGVGSKEIASRMGTTESNVNSLLARATRRMRCSGRVGAMAKLAEAQREISELVRSGVLYEPGPDTSAAYAVGLGGVGTHHGRDRG